MRLTDPNESAMHELAAACDGRNFENFYDALLEGMQGMQDELTKWINEKTLYDLPYVAACLLMCGNAVMETLNPLERSVAEDVMKLLGTVTARTPTKEEEHE